MMKLLQVARVATVALIMAVQSVPALAQQSPATNKPERAPVTSQPAPTQPSIQPASPTPETSKPAAGVGPLRELSPWSMFLSADILVDRKSVV